MVRSMPMDVETLLDQIADRGGDAEGLIQAMAMNGSDEEAIIPELAARLSGSPDATMNRRAAGAFYTPPALIALILDHTLDRWVGTQDTELPVVLDPACGTGRFLLAAGRRLVDRRLAHGGGTEAAAWRAIGPRLRGFDVDPLATAWLRGRLTALADGDATAASGVRTIDAFDPSALPQAQADVILGNPPFGSPLRSHTTAEHLRRRAADLYGVSIGPYADQAAIFLLAAARSLRPGGWLGMVQPLSVLAARDTAAIREAVRATGTVSFAWSSAHAVFDAQVHTVAIGLTAGHTAPSINRWADLPPRRLTSAPLLGAGEPWSPLASAAVGIPNAPEVHSSGVLRDIAAATADFRDQYYGLRGCLTELDGPPTSKVVPIVTSGVLDPARCHWEDRDVRLHGRRWRRPGVQLDKLDGAMRRWSADRLVPKILLPTQTRVLEPVLDADGRWLPSVPVMTITSARLADVAAVLASPIVSLLALHRRLGTARSPQAIKLSATEVLELPMPAGREAWARASLAFMDAHHATDAATCLRSLTQCGRDMHRAYGLTSADSEAVLAWWIDRLPARR